MVRKQRVWKRRRDGVRQRYHIGRKKKRHAMIMIPRDASFKEIKDILEKEDVKHPHKLAKISHRSIMNVKRARQSKRRRF